MKVNRVELQVKVLDVLRKELTTEEYVLIESIKIGHSLEELDEYSMKVDAMKAAAIIVLKEEREAEKVKTEANNNAIVNKLEKHVGLSIGRLPHDEFILSVAQFYSTAGGISAKQSAAILKRYK